MDSHRRNPPPSGSTSATPSSPATGAALPAKQGRPADDARASYGYLLAKHYGYRESRLAFGGYAWAGGGGKNPQVADLIDQITSTTSRLTGDQLVPCPDV